MTVDDTTPSEREVAVAYLDANNRWALNIADPGRDNLFVGQIYVRGAAALHALRAKIGDAAFFAGARLWLTRHNDATATTEDFEAVMERASGQQLDAFFDDWLREGDRPAMPQLSGAKDSVPQGTARHTVFSDAMRR